MKYLEVVTTVATLAQARALARAVVEDRLAACAHICQIESCYHWDGALRDETEFKIVFKTLAEHYERIEAVVRERHPWRAA